MRCNLTLFWFRFVFLIYCSSLSWTNWWKEGPRCNSFYSYIVMYQIGTSKISPFFPWNKCVLRLMFGLKNRQKDIFANLCVQLSAFLELRRVFTTAPVTSAQDKQGQVGTPVVEMQSPNALAWHAESKRVEPSQIMCMEEPLNVSKIIFLLSLTACPNSVCVISNSENYLLSMVKTTRQRHKTDFIKH